LILDSEIKEFIRNHKNEDVRKLALKKSQLSSDRKENNLTIEKNKRKNIRVGSAKLK